MASPALTSDDLEVAEASVRFAVTNCPVEGVLSNEDGSPVSFDELHGLLELLSGIGNQPTPTPMLNDDDLATLKVVIDYTSENCPVEAVATFHDGRSISGRDIITLAGKLKERTLT